MAQHKWDTSNRRRDPANWNAIRMLVAERDGHRCQEYMRDNSPCPDIGTECDHIIPLSRGGTDNMDNLRMLCKWHHARKSSAEGNASKTGVSEQRPKPQHPGIIT
jgi:5-methylcytosine-specific restriction endonuclease McrA